MRVRFTLSTPLLHNTGASATAAASRQQQLGISEVNPPACCPVRRPTRRVPVLPALLLIGAWVKPHLRAQCLAARARCGAWWAAVGGLALHRGPAPLRPCTLQHASQHASQELLGLQVGVTIWPAWPTGCGSTGAPLPGQAAATAKVERRQRRRAHSRQLAHRRSFSSSLVAQHRASSI